jgi:cytochrome c-type biogenesis protein CcmH/NrfG
MSDHLKLHDEGDEQVTRGLRQIYAAPTDDNYWRSLQARILSRLTEPETIAWWDELDRWVRPALVAAAILLLATSVAAVRNYQAEQELAYEDMLTPTTLPVETAVRPTLRGREGTFRYIMTRPPRGNR